jgi:cell division protein FtsQ
MVTVGRFVLGLLFVLASSGAVAWGARRYLVSSPRFALRTLQVEGNVRLSPQEVAERGGLALGDNVFALDLVAVERALANEPWIASVQVRRKLPGSVTVVLTEHDPVALVSLESRLYLVSRQGRVFKEVAPNDPLDLPVVTGLTARDVVSDREGVEKEVERALDVIDELGKSPIGQRFPVQEIHLERDGSLQAIVGRDAIALHLGKPPVRGKLEQAARVLDEIAARKAQPSIVFLDNEGSPERVVVRLR